MLRKNSCFILTSRLLKPMLDTSMSTACECKRCSLILYFVLRFFHTRVRINWQIPFFYFFRLFFIFPQGENATASRFSVFDSDSTMDQNRHYPWLLLLSPVYMINKGSLNCSPQKCIYFPLCCIWGCFSCSACWWEEGKIELFAHLLIPHGS